MPTCTEAVLKSRPLPTSKRVGLEFWTHFTDVKVSQAPDDVIHAQVCSTHLHTILCLKIVLLQALHILTQTTGYPHLIGTRHVKTNVSLVSVAVLLQPHTNKISTHMKRYEMEPYKTPSNRLRFHCRAVI